MIPIKSDKDKKKTQYLCEVLIGGYFMCSSVRLDEEMG
jgi:hypothetical protein